jgi:hypothetical protein
MKKFATAAFLTLSAAFTPAHAEFQTGNKLLSGLNEPAGSVPHMVAFGYIIGVTDAHTSITICPPDAATQGQVVDIVKRWLVANPAERHHTGDVIVEHILSRTWPCKK